VLHGPLEASLLAVQPALQVAVSLPQAALLRSGSLLLRSDLLRSDLRRSGWLLQLSWN
jgi:hypothetical protein